MAEKLTWQHVIGLEKDQSYFKRVMGFVTAERHAGKTIYPPKEDVFNAFRYTEFDDIAIVILGQDPYHGHRQAHGLSFSVLPDVPPPPSLINIYKELAQDISDFAIPKHGYLGYWAKQGVLMLNTVLTVEAGKAHSHAKIGWETFTDHVIAAINQHREGVIFLLWGAHAQKKGQLIDARKHHLLSAVHPSPLSAHRGFFGSKHFSKANEILVRQGKRPIDWQPRLPQQTMDSTINVE